MNVKFQVCLVLLFVGLAQATVFGVYADPNACVQTTYEKVCPITLPAPEPNEPWGSILGPIPGDPNVWEVLTGPWKRPYGRVCDPDGDRVSIEFLGGTSPAAVQVEADVGLWTFAAEVTAGLNAWRFEATDGQASRIVTVVVIGKRREPPVME